MHETFESVQHGATPLIDGPLKIYVVLVALVLTVSTGSFDTHLLAAALFLGFSVEAVGVGPVRWFGIPVAFLLPGIGIVLLVTPGTPVVTWWLFSVSEAGVETAAHTLSRSVAALSILSFLVLTTPIHAVVSTLRGLPLPDIVVELFLYVYRAIQLTIEEAAGMRSAASARLGFGGRRSTYHSIKLLAGSLLVRSFDRVERFGDSLRSRNYTGSVPVASSFESRGYPYAVAVLGSLVVMGWL